MVSSLEIRSTEAWFTVSVSEMVVTGERSNKAVRSIDVVGLYTPFFALPFCCGALPCPISFFPVVTSFFRWGVSRLHAERKPFDYPTGSPVGLHIPIDRMPFVSFSLGEGSCDSLSFPRRLRGPIGLLPFGAVRFGLLFCTRCVKRAERAARSRAFPSQPSLFCPSDRLSLDSLSLMLAAWV